MSERDGSRVGEMLRLAGISGLGTGFAPFASGTWGSGAAVVLYVLAWGACGAMQAPRLALDGLFGALIIVATLLCGAWGDWAIARFGRKDPKQCTLDEFAGQWVALLFMPAALPWAGTAAMALPGAGAGGAGAAPGLLWHLTGVLVSQFLLFRAFDVWKPAPCRQLERLRGGWGIVADDLFAGVYANIAGQVLWRIVYPAH